MFRQSFHSRFLWLSLLLALAGCGEPIVGPGYEGQPLVTLEGQMTPTPEANITGQVRLALVWYPQWLATDDASGGLGTPKAVVTEDVIYRAASR